MEDDYPFHAVEAWSTKLEKNIVASPLKDRES